VTSHYWVTPFDASTVNAKDSIFSNENNSHEEYLSRPYQYDSALQGVLGEAHDWLLAHHHC